MFQLRSLSAETRARKNLGSDKCQSLREGVISVDWSVVTIEIHKRPERAECHPVSTFVNLLLWLVVLNIGPTRRKNTRQSTSTFLFTFHNSRRGYIQLLSSKIDIFLHFFTSSFYPAFIQFLSSFLLSLDFLAG